MHRPCASSRSGAASLHCLRTPCRCSRGANLVGVIRFSLPETMQKTCLKLCAAHSPDAPRLHTPGYPREAVPVIRKMAFPFCADAAAPSGCVWKAPGQTPSASLHTDGTFPGRIRNRPGGRQSRQNHFALLRGARDNPLRARCSCPFLTRLNTPSCIALILPQTATQDNARLCNACMLLFLHAAPAPDGTGPAAHRSPARAGA